MRIATADSWYEKTTLDNGVTHIHEPFIKTFYRCNIWHIRGRNRDMLVDSGMGVVSLSDQISLVTERPCVAVASHTHFDHIGCHHEFSERLVHHAEAELMAHPTRQNTLAKEFVCDDIFTRMPPAPYCSDSYSVIPTKPTGLLKDNDIIDLGDRHFKVIHTPGHSPGHIMLWEEATGVLFSGDMVYDGPLIDDVYHSNMDAYIESMEKILNLPVQVVHGGHFPSFAGVRYRELIRAYLRSKG
ncbi:MAG: glyoxylase-like metal-dependent hydrolase (beta-lactamase superfamily II) [Psychromonas sp.]|jgi:glyoxylase-like metal-dependent hydrolase (beta-lactamase superfamily II)